MWLYLLIALAMLLIIGNALILLRTAKKPKVPESFRPRSDDEDEDSGW